MLPLTQQECASRSFRLSNWGFVNMEASLLSVVFEVLAALQGEQIMPASAL